MTGRFNQTGAVGLTAYVPEPSLDDGIDLAMDELFVAVVFGATHVRAPAVPAQRRNRPHACKGTPTRVRNTRHGLSVWHPLGED